MAIETWQDAIGTLAVLKGYPNVVLRIKHIHQDVLDPRGQDDIRGSWDPPKAPAACVCEVVEGTPPKAWGEPCTPYGHYRVAAKDLVLVGDYE